VGQEKKSPLGPSRPLWSKLLPFLAAALGGVIMLISASRALSFLRVAYGPSLHDTYVVFPAWLMPSFLIGLFVLISGIAMALVMRAQNRDTSRQVIRRGASKKTDVLNAVHAIFDFVSLLVPRRLANEELGDALEVINREIAKRRPRWRIWLKVGTTLFWITINSLRWICGAFRGRRRFR